MSPAELHVLMYIYAIPQPLEKLTPTIVGSEGLSKVSATLLNMDLIAVAQTPSGYVITPRGEAYLDAIRNMPLPECKWVVPRENILNYLHCVEA